MKQILRNFTQFSIFFKRSFLVSIFLLVFGSIFGQNAIVGSGFSTGWGGGGCPTGSANFKYLDIKAGGTYGVTTTANGTGDQYFRFGVDWDGITTQLAITPGVDVFVIPNTTYTLNANCTPSGAMKYDVPSTSYNYVFKTLNAGTNPTGKFIFFEVQGAIRSVIDVTQSPMSANVPLCSPTTITATVDGNLALGQEVYMRYTNDGYATSTVLKLIAAGPTTYQGTIPSSINTATASVSYYVFTSGTTTPSGADADLYTINLNNNGGSNYSYSVSNLGTTAIPDPAFEQALIDLDLDCEIDGKVLTSNISTITNLNVSYKSISDLTGIQDFVGLEILDCYNNSLTSLDISSLTNLKELNCYFNYLTSLDVSKVKLMEYMDCGDNMLTSLDVTGLTALSYLYTGYNNLSALNLTNLMASANMYCYENTPLNCIIADDPAAAAANANWQKDAFSTYSISNPNGITGNVTGGTSVCMGSTSGLLTLNDAVGTIARWESAVSPFTTWTTISNTSNTYTSGVLMETTQFRAVTESNCQTYASTPATVTIETTTWTGTWSNGTPTASKTAIISANFTADADLTACSLIVNNNAIVTIPSGNNIIVTGAVTVTAPATLTLSNNSNLIQVNNTTNSGSITVNRNSSLLKRLDYTLWSSPVSGVQTLADFSPLTSQDPSRFYSFDPTYTIGGVNGAYSAITTPTSTTFAAGAGYLIRMPNTADAVTPTAYAGQFTGLPNNGDISVALIDGLAAGLRYNLVGNPYPSTVNMTQFVSDNSSNIESTLYFWRKTNGVGTAYCTWAPAVSPATGTFVSNGNTQSVDPLGVLQTGQGFFVEAKSGATSLTFNNGQRVADNAGQFFKTKQVADAGRIWLNATNTSGDFSQMALTYSSQATQGVDVYDGKYINDSKFALTSNINNAEYTIQSRSGFDVSDVVALNFKTATSGDYTIAIDHLDGLFVTDQDIYLVDSKTGAETNLKTSPYNFTADSGTDNSRFTLKYQKTLKVDAATFNDNSVKVYINNGTLYVNSGALAIANIKIFDIQGRLIKEQTNIKATTATISNLRASNQVLIVQVRGEDNSEVTKKVMN